MINGFSGSGIALVTGFNIVVTGSFIGTNAAGTAADANGTGISISAASSNNTIGGSGAGQGNIIAFNTNDGVLITDPTTDDNAVRGNSIYANGGKGIDLNSTGNFQQTFPTLGAAQGSSTEITGTFMGVANETYAS